MQLTYRGQTYSYPYSEPVQVSSVQPLCIYRGVKTSLVPMVSKPAVPNVTSLCYRGISYLKTLTPAFS